MSLNELITVPNSLSDECMKRENNNLKNLFEKLQNATFYFYESIRISHEETLKHLIFHAKKIKYSLSKNLTFAL